MWQLTIEPIKKKICNNNIFSKTFIRKHVFQHNIYKKVKLKLCDQIDLHDGTKITAFKRSEKCDHKNKRLTYIQFRILLKKCDKNHVENHVYFYANDLETYALALYYRCKFKKLKCYQCCLYNAKFIKIKDVTHMPGDFCNHCGEYFAFKYPCGCEQTKNEVCFSKFSPTKFIKSDKKRIIMFYDIESCQTEEGYQLPVMIAFSFCNLPDYVDLSFLNRFNTLSKFGDRYIFGIKPSRFDVEQEKEISVRLDFIEVVLEILDQIKDELCEFISIGYNSSRYDDIFIFRKLVKQINDYFKPGLKNINIIKKGSALKTYRVKINKCLFKTFDLVEYTKCKLKVACNEFNLENKKIDFSIQQIFDMYIQKNDENYSELLQYNLYDIISLEELFFKVEEKYKNLVGDHNTSYKLTDFITIPSFISSFMYEVIQLKKNCFVPKNALFDFVRSSCYGGKVHLDFVGVVNVNLMEVDVNSEYPQAMKAKYPSCSQPYFNTPSCNFDHLIGGNFENIFTQVPCGVFYCKMTPVNTDFLFSLNYAPIPSKDLDGDTIWHLGSIVGVYTKPHICLALYMGYRVQILQHDLNWISDKEDNLFKEFIDFLAETKEKAKSKIERDVAKIALNSLYGKTVENPYDQEIKITEQQDIRLIENVTSVSSLDENHFFVRQDTKSLRGENNRAPNYIGNFLLAHAHTILCMILTNIPYIENCRKNNLPCSARVVYVDTDSIYIHSKYILQLPDEMFSSNLIGTYTADNKPVTYLKKELGFCQKCNRDTVISKAIIVGKKCYCFIPCHGSIVIRAKGQNLLKKDTECSLCKIFSSGQSRFRIKKKEKNQKEEEVLNEYTISFSTKPLFSKYRRPNVFTY